MPYPESIADQGAGDQIQRDDSFGWYIARLAINGNIRKAHQQRGHSDYISYLSF